MFGVGRDLCGSSSPTPLPKQGHLRQAAQDFVQAGLDALEVPLTGPFSQAKGSRALIPAYKSPNGTGRVCECRGTLSTMDSLPSKVVDRNETAIFVYPVVCLDVFKELFKVEQFTEIQ